MKLVGEWCKIEIKVNDEPFLVTTELNIVTFILMFYFLLGMSVLCKYVHQSCQFYNNNSSSNNSWL
jgi:hypothetical protein